MVVSLQTRRSLKGARLSRKEIPRVAILTKKVKAYQSYLEE